MALIVDNFERADGSPGADWSVYSDFGAAIRSGRICSFNTVSSSGKFETIGWAGTPAVPSNFTVSGTLHIAAGGDAVGLMGRMSSTSIDDPGNAGQVSGFFLIVNTTSSLYYFGALVSSTTFNDWIHAAGSPFVDGDTVQLRCIGSYVRLMRNGSLVSGAVSRQFSGGVAGPAFSRDSDGLAFSGWDAITIDSATFDSAQQIDDFERADVAPGINWRTFRGGGNSIVGGRLVSAGGGGDYDDVWVGSEVPPNQYIRGTLYLPSGTGSYAGLCVRAGTATVDPTSGQAAAYYFNTNGSNYSFGKFTGGTFTVRFSGATPFVDGDIVELNVTDDPDNPGQFLVSLVNNSVLVASFSDATYADGGVGVFNFNSTGESDLAGWSSITLGGFGTFGDSDITLGVLTCTAVAALALQAVTSNTLSALTLSSQGQLTEGESMDMVATPTFSLPAGHYHLDVDESVTISCDTVGSAVYYTLDGTDPTTGSELYSTAISLSNHHSITLKARGFADGMLPSYIAQATYRRYYPVTYDNV